jgi:hypothetical protein
MIQSLSHKYRKHIAYPLFIVFYMQFLSPLYAAVRMDAGMPLTYGSPYNGYSLKREKSNNDGVINMGSAPNNKFKLFNRKDSVGLMHPNKLLIGGPNSPEASSFKAVGSDNLVNLFTGSFSYSIPLLDVDGYPVNLFYNGGITMDQDASWVGLGWNINPGTVNRDMRGVPDDFDGTDLLTVTQRIKTNQTFGGNVGADFELLGIKGLGGGLSVGVSYNTYLGPAIDLGANISTSISALKNLKFEKSAKEGLTLDLDLSSRGGFTISPSYNAQLSVVRNKVDEGLKLSTSYNSRTGLKSMTITGQATLERDNCKWGHTMDNIENGALGSLLGSLHQGGTISFAKPSYMPSMRMPMENLFAEGQLELGGGIYNFRGSATFDGYYSQSDVPSEWQTVTKPLVGYMYSQNAINNEDAVMDFTRVNDAEVTPNTPVISAPVYTYDIFSIQGEGTGGTIRAYRSDMGYVRDNVTISKDNSVSLGADIAPPGHFGGNFNFTSAPTRVGGWQNANNTSNALLQTLAFKQADQSGSSSFENVYFKNPGEASVTNDEIVNRIGGDNLVKFQLTGAGNNPTLNSNLELFDKITGTPVNTPPLAISNAGLQNRDKRTQVITMLNAGDASRIGLDTWIKNYSGTFDPTTHTLQYSNIPRVGGYRKKNHISEIDVVEQNGMRYVYGIPVYNVRQKDFTFSVNQTPADAVNNLVNYSSDEPTVGSSDLTGVGIDGYVQTQETPAYASSFLLTGLVSPDYVDVTGDGITEDDQGTAVKFNYTMSSGLHTWRTPRAPQGSPEETPTDGYAIDPASPGYLASFNEGLRTEKKDNKATISYGERESWYLSSIESKSMIAIFTTGSRYDGKGVNYDHTAPLDVNGLRTTGNSGIYATVDNTEDAVKELDRIDLYTKADIKQYGIANAKPIKTITFNYSTELCQGTPDNANIDPSAGGPVADPDKGIPYANSGGKLTLESIEFSYNGQSKLQKERYVFSYGDENSKVDNPDYAYNSTDRWGTYKPVTDPTTGAAVNPNGLSNIDYPYTNSDKATDDKYAAAWNLKKILLPSGGQIEVNYESNDYAYVQDRRACNMFNIAGFGFSTDYNGSNEMFAAGSGPLLLDNDYLYVKLPQPLVNTDPVKIKQEIYSKYLIGLNQLVFKLQINMPNGVEPLTTYVPFDITNNANYGICTNNPGYMYFMIGTPGIESPLSRSSIGFLTGDLPDQAFPGYNIDVTNLLDFVEIVPDLVRNLALAFSNVDQQMRIFGWGRSIVLANSFIRLDNPAEQKYGGGARVKEIVLKDNWNAMTGQYLSQYGQDYDYTTTEVDNGVTNTISSGVASYEPGVGSEENPFREALSFSNKLPLASAQYGAIEMPMLEALYPSPVLGYSKVTVRSINRNATQQNGNTLRSAIGKQVTEFYTAKDYPTISNYTPMTSLDYNTDPAISFFYKKIVNDRAISQGFIVETNDMHGKLKSQTAYSESDENTPLSYSYHTYINTGQNGLNDKVNFVHNDENGTVIPGNMGVDMELMTDIREFSLQSNGLSIQAQVDISPPIWIQPTVYPLVTYEENIYRAVTCTKVINYHAIEDNVTVMDKGSVVSTKTIAYDAETGAPIVTQTANEFNDPIYNTKYPAYWAYSGMAPAYKNIGMQFSGVTFNSGQIVSGVPDQSVFESGDELYITASSGSTTCVNPGSPSDVTKLWVFDANKNNTALTVPSANRNLYFMDSQGNLYTNSNVSFTIVRSGKRNELDLNAASATTMQNPIQNIGGVNKLLIDNTSNTVNASAVEYKEKWQTDNDVFNRYSVVTPVTGNIVNGDFSEGNTGFTSDYTYRPGGDANDDYNIGTNVQAWNPVLGNCGDHTSGTGNMMMVSGYSPVANRKVWEESVTVQPNADYDFSAWIQNILTSGNGPQFQFFINGVQVGNNFQLIPSSSNFQQTPSIVDFSSTCSWNLFYTVWNSGMNTTADIKIINTSGVHVSNDFALDDISFNISTCEGSLPPPAEVTDCAGYLEKNINPYTKDLLGNFRPYRSYTYYGDRNKPDPTTGTAIRKNGYIAGFSSYWNFDDNSNLVPAPSTNWVWNSELTKVNSKGQELETMDPLNRYTSAQYGYAKNLPIAVTQNARYGESFYEGFEDDDYSEALNSISPQICPQNKYINFTGGENERYLVLQSTTSSIVPNFEQTQVQAHTGNHLFFVSPNNQYTIPLTVAQTVVDNFNIQIQPTSINNAPWEPVNSHGVEQYIYSNGQLVNSTQITTNDQNTSNSFTGLEITPAIVNGAGYQYSGTTTITQHSYFQPPTTGDYTFHFRSSGLLGKAQIIIRDDRNSGTPDFSHFSFTPNYEYDQAIAYGSYTNGEDAYLCVVNGTYNYIGWPLGRDELVNIPMCTNHLYEFILNYQADPTTLGNATNCYDRNFLGAYFDDYSLTGDMPNTPFYTASQQLDNTCYFNNPIPATTDMQNQTFAFVPGKQMQFSAWVREDCGDPLGLGAACTATAYANDHIAIQFPGSTDPVNANVILKPSGNIIDGWQKVEGVFTVPTDATTANLVLANDYTNNTNSTNRVYFDDIRIHPFNANMKSYVYDPLTLRLTSELDENNYATFYDYDEEGQLIRVKKETTEGVKTINETRNAKQSKVITVQ